MGNPRSLSSSNLSRIYPGSVRLSDFGRGRLARPSHFQKLTRQFAERYGSRAVSTQTGRQAWDSGDTYGNLNAFVAAAMRRHWQFTMEPASRNEDQARLMAEIYAVASPLARGINDQANDAANDSMADTQPDAIIVRGETAENRAKIRGILRDGFRRLKIGENGAARIRRGLRTGNCFGQKVFERDGFRWHFTKVMNMPTYEMIRNPVDDSYVQIRKQSVTGGLAIGNPIIGQWGPGFIAKLALEEDHNAIYGTPILEHVKIDYRLFIAACEDEAIAGRTRAPARFKYTLGNEKWGQSVDPDYVEAWKKRNNITPTTVVTDFFLIAGWEDVESIGGDAAGVTALMEMTNDHMQRMKHACGFREDSEKLAGRGLESTDTAYAGRINALRLADWKYKKSVGDDILLFEGYDDIDWSTNIPSLGETDHNRSTRLGALLGSAQIGHEVFAAGMGYKDVDDYRQDITETAKYYDELNAGLNTIQIQYQLRAGSGKKTDQTRNPRGDVVGTDSPGKGADPQASRSRRKQQKVGGKTPTGARAHAGLLRAAPEEALYDDAV